MPGDFYPGIRRPGREAHQLPPSSTENNNVWDCNSTVPYAFTAYTGTILTSSSPVPTSCSSEFCSPLRAVVWLLILHLQYTRLLAILLAVEVNVTIRNELPLQAFFCGCVCGECPFARNTVCYELSEDLVAYVPNFQSGIAILKSCGF